jgi:hypothetical protein
MVATKKRKHRKMILRRAERAYARSISLREDQIKRIEEAGVKNVSELFQKLVDEWLLARDKEEAAKLRERAELFTYKWRCLMTEEKKTVMDAEVKAAMDESRECTRKREEIEENIEADEEEKRRRT